MATFGIDATGEEANRKVRTIADRLGSDNLLKNPFVAKAVEYAPGSWAFSITPVYPNIGYFFIFPLLIFILRPRGLGYLALLAAGVMLLINLWWAPRFYAFLFSLATKRRSQYVAAGTVLDRVVLCGTAGSDRILKEPSQKRR